MVYLGSKRKLQKYLLPIINNYIKENHITDFYDVFCGGCNLIDGIECENLYANDLSPTLIALHQTMQSNAKVIPENGSREMWNNCYTEYKRLMKDYEIKKEIWEENSKIPLWEIGAIEWYSSYSRGGFPRGYIKPTNGRDYYNEGYRNHFAQSQKENYKKIKFSQGSYTDIDIPENALIYCDSPYHNTKEYSISKNFDYNEYYNWLKNKSKTNPIFISEQEMPEEFECIWSLDVIRQTRQDKKFKACEKLYFIDNRT